MTSTIAANLDQASKAITDYYKNNEYISYHSTPDTFRAFANVKMMNPATMLTDTSIFTALTNLKPIALPSPSGSAIDDLEYTLSMLLAKTQREDEMTGFGGTEQIGLQYTVADAFAYKDGAFFLKPRIEYSDTPLQTESFVSSEPWSWSNFTDMLFGTEGFDTPPPPMVSGLRFVLADGYMGTDTKYFDEGISTDVNAWFWGKSLKHANWVRASGLAKGMRNIEMMTTIANRTPSMSSIVPLASFTVMMEGYFNPPRSGDYKFSIETGGSGTCYVWISRDSNDPIVKSDTLITSTETSSKISLSAGVAYYIRIMYGYKASPMKPAYCKIMAKSKAKPSLKRWVSAYGDPYTLDTSVTSPQVTNAMAISQSINVVTTNTPTDSVVTTNTPTDSVVTTNTPSVPVIETSLPPAPVFNTSNRNNATLHPIIITPNITGNVTPTVCDNLNSIAFQNAIKARKRNTFSIEWFGYIAADDTTTYSIYTSNSANITYTTRIWVGNDALVSYATSDISGWNGYSNIIGLSPPTTLQCVSGGRYPIRIHYAQLDQPFDNYAFNVFVTASGSSPAALGTAPPFIFRTDSSGMAYEPPQISYMITEITFPSMTENMAPNTVCIGAYLDIAKGNNIVTNRQARLLVSTDNPTISTVVVSNSSDTQYGFFSDGTLRGITDPAISTGTSSTEPVVKRQYALSVTDTGNISIVDDTDVVIQTIPCVFPFVSANNGRVFPIAVKQWLIERGETPTLGSDTQKVKNIFTPKTTYNTRLYSNPDSTDPVTIGPGGTMEAVYSANGMYKLSVLNGSLVMQTGMAYNLDQSPIKTSYRTLTNTSNVWGASYLQNALTNTRYIIPEKSDIFGSDNTYTNYQSSSSTAANTLWLPPQNVESSSSYISIPGASNGDCKAECDDKGNMCSHYYYNTMSNNGSTPVSKCHVNIDGSPETYNRAYNYQPDPSRQLSANLYIKNRMIKSSCAVTPGAVLDENGSFLRPLTISQRTDTLPGSQILPISATMTNGSVFSHITEGVCGDKTYKDALARLGGIEGFVSGYDTVNACNTANTDGTLNAACKAAILKNAKALGTELETQKNAGLMTSYANIESKINNLVTTPSGGTSKINTLTNTWSSGGGGILRTFYTNAGRDEVMDAGDIALRDEKYATATQNTMFVMGSMAMVSVVLLAVIAAGK